MERREDRMACVGAAGKKMYAKRWSGKKFLVLPRWHGRTRTSRCSTGACVAHTPFVVARCNSRYVAVAEKWTEKDMRQFTLASTWAMNSGPFDGRMSDWRRYSAFFFFAGSGGGVSACHF